MTTKWSKPLLFIILKIFPLKMATCTIITIDQIVIYQKERETSGDGINKKVVCSHLADRKKWNRWNCRRYNTSVIIRMSFFFSNSILNGLDYFKLILVKIMFKVR